MDKDTVLNSLSSNMNRRDEVPNQELAERIAKAKDTEAIPILIDLLKAKKALQNDAIKVLYEIGEREPSLIAPYFENFMELLDHKNNRLQWGGMTAINTITLLRKEDVYKNLSLLVELGTLGSVITRDQLMYVLQKMASQPPFRKESMAYIFEILSQSPPNQFPKYAEETLKVISKEDGKVLLEILTNRVSDLEKESSRKRVHKVIRALAKKME
ncbi:hypothetical protein POV27_08860 [Aureisphaera galaxeae]|uniref:hypothetical protein n=1 Tax=Aureisphaera galaxeae TaxID=1538023 RepID=UPI002350D51A|nr:hypothetical protein [Aureisphaera galaxeae]MDC8004159.1 hypothetical protein [Aureisphaera galaxeae]